MSVWWHAVWNTRWKWLSDLSRQWRWPDGPRPSPALDTHLNTHFFPNPWQNDSRYTHTHPFPLTNLPGAACSVLKWLMSLYLAFQNAIIIKTFYLEFIFHYVKIHISISLKNLVYCVNGWDLGTLWDSKFITQTESCHKYPSQFTDRFLGSKLTYT